MLGDPCGAGGAKAEKRGPLRELELGPASLTGAFWFCGVPAAGESHGILHRVHWNNTKKSP